MPLILAIVLASGCYLRSEPVSASPDAAASDAAEHVDATVVARGERLDLLFVIDRSASMEEERPSLVIEIPRMVRILASGDVDSDGTLEFEPVRSIQVGVVTTDVASGPSGVAGCADVIGGGGVLATRAGPFPGCDASYPPVLRFEVGGGDPTDFAMSVACVAVGELGGCAIEQPLEAALRALSPSRAQPWTAVDYVAPAFLDGSIGHGDGVNDGFAREGSMLVIVVITDEDDTSIADLELFDPASTRYDGPLETRAARYPEALQPIERYVRGLIALRRDPRDLAVVLIAGIRGDARPMTTCERASTVPDDAIDPDLSAETSEEGVVCHTANGRAQSASRLVRAACELERRGASAQVVSICDSSYRAALDVVVTRIGGG